MGLMPKHRDLSRINNKVAEFSTQDPGIPGFTFRVAMSLLKKAKEGHFAVRISPTVLYPWV